MLVRVADDERFVREGSELITAVDVPATATALGTTVTVPTLEGEEEIDVPAGTAAWHRGDPARPRRYRRSGEAGAATSSWC